MHAIMSRKALTYTLALLVAGAAIVVAMVTSDSARSASPPTNSSKVSFSSLAPYKAGDLSPSALRALDGLRQLNVDPKVVPASIPAFATPKHSSQGADTQLISGAGDQVCLVTQYHGLPGPSVGCGPMGRGLDADLWAGVTLLDSGYLVSGVAPDGTSDVTVETSDGSTTAVEVGQNTFGTVVNDAPVRIKWADVSGAEHSNDLTIP